MTPDNTAPLTAGELSELEVEAYAELDEPLSDCQSSMPSLTLLRLIAMARSSAGSAEEIARALFFAPSERWGGTAAIHRDEVWENHPDADRSWEHDGQFYQERGRDYYRGLAHAILALGGKGKEDSSAQDQSDRPREDGWRPIDDDTPRDRFLLLWVPASGNMDGFRVFAKWQGGNWYGVDEGGLTFQPTVCIAALWQPLPAPPSSQTEADRASSGEAL